MFVSVVIPTYNRSKFVKEAIESVLAQSYKNFELIVVDDGSTDDTREVIEKISDSRLKYFYKDNGGHCSSRNYGFIKAKGEYVALLDHDDLWPENYLETMVKQLEGQAEYSFAYSRVTLLHEDGSTSPFATEDRYVSGWVTKSFFKGGPCLMPSATMFKKEILKDFYFDEALKLGEDNDFFLRLSVKTPFLFISEATVLRRAMADSLSANVTIDNQCYGILSVERFYYRLGGNKLVPAILARRSISHKYRRAAKTIYKLKARKAYMILLMRAISYYPFDIRLYFDLCRFLLLSKKEDPDPNWKMPGSLPLEITVTKKSGIS